MNNIVVERMRIKRMCTAMELAIRAGLQLNELFCKVKNSEEKGVGTLDMVSDADKLVEEMVFSCLVEKYPNDGILSEEREERTRRSDYRWIIDPLDGTHNFLMGFNEFGFLLALEEKGQVIFGICYFPKLKELFVAEKGKGAYLNGERIRVSETKSFRGEFFCSDGAIRKNLLILRDIKRFCKLGCRLRVYGSSAFSMMRVAKGNAIVATNRAGTPWDIAAPALILEEAGGKVTDENSNPWSIDSKNIIATNGHLHNDALTFFNIL